jgi:AsmA-like C-terminal region
VFFGLVILAAIAALVGAALLGGSLLLDLPSVKSQVERKLSQAVNGHIAWDTLQVRLLLTPHVELRGVTIDIPGQLHARIERAEARLRLRSLLRGQGEVTAVAVTRPVVRIDITPSASDESQPTADPVAAYRSLMGPLLRAVHNAAPDALLEVDEADVDLRAPALPNLQVRGLSLRARADARGVDLEANAASNFWDHLNFLGRVGFADLSGHFSLEVTELKPQAWLDPELSGGAVGLDIPRATLRAQLVTDARTDLHCNFGLDLASVQVTHAGQRLPISDSAFKGKAVLRAREIEVSLSELQVGSVFPSGRAALRMTSDGEKPRIALDIPRLDAGVLRDAVLALAADNEPVRRHAPRVLGGEITNLGLLAQADTWHDVLGAGHLSGSATIAHATIILPAIEKKATELGGRIELSAAAVELTQASAQLGPSHLTDARLRYSIRDGATSARIGFDLDFAQALEVARQALPEDRPGALSDIEAATGRLQGRVDIPSMSSTWKATIDVARADASFRVRSLPWPMSLHAGRASISPGQVSVNGLQGAVGGSKFADIGATLVLGPVPRITGGSGRATLALEEIYPWVRSNGGSSDLLRDIDSISGSLQITLNSLSGELGQPSELDYDAMVRPEQLSVEMKQLPAPLIIVGGTAHIDPGTVTLDRIGAAMLDAQAVLSGEIIDYRSERLRIRGSIADAVAGEGSAHWIWQRLGAPAQFEPRTPLRFAVERATWSPNRAVDVQGSVNFEAGPEVTVDLSWEPDALDLRRLVIRDRASQATFGLRVKDHLLEASFSGSIFARSIAAMLKRPGEYQGQATGDLRATLDLERRGRTSAQGHITAEALDIDELLPAPVRELVRVDRLDLSADGSSMQIHKAAVSWAQQVATITGEINRADKGLFVDLQLDSPGIQVDELLHRGATSDQEPAGETKPADTHGAEIFSRLWSVPITGQIRLQSNFVQFQRYRLAPVTASLTLGEDRAELRLQDTKLCGLSLPLTVQFVPAGFTAAAQIQARKQQLEDVARCLTDERLLLTGEFDARANLTTKGTSDQLLTNLEGNVHLESRNGAVRKFALIGNILAITDIASSFNRSLSDLSADGFPYRTVDIDGHFSQGRFIVEDFIFDSSAFGLAAVGSVGLAQRDTQLTVLLAPFSGFTNLMRKVPVIGYLIGGTLTSIPVSVRGDIRDPTVVPLDPGAIASGLTALFTRALSVPERMLAPSRPSPGSTAPSTGR